MGIQGLLRFLKDATSEVHIREYSGRCVAVDTYCWLHRGAFACADKLAKGEKTDQYVKYCMKFVDMLESYNVRPILVFDGCHLPSKKEVEKQRRERRELYMQKAKQFLREGKSNEARDAFTKCISVTPQMALSVMQVARERGIDCIVAPYEADAQLAFLLKHGYAQAVVTEDSDLLCFGCERVILKMDLTGRAQEVSTAKLDQVKNLQGFTIDTFRHMCILSGCDYLPSIKGVGLVKSCKALKLAKNKDIYQTVRKLNQYIKGLGQVEPEYVIGFERADKTFLYQLVIDPRTRKLIPLNPYPADVTHEDVKYAGPLIPDDQVIELAWGNVDINNGKRIGDFNADRWLESKSWNGDRVMKRSSIWQKDFLKKTTSNTIDKMFGKKSKQPAIELLRGKEAIVDMKKFGFTKKNKNEELMESDRAVELCSSQIEDSNSKIDDDLNETKHVKKTKNELLANEENDRVDLLNIYKTSGKTQSPDKSLRQRMRENKTAAFPNCIVKSRFFSVKDHDPSFFEETQVTQIDETPETSNSSFTNNQQPTEAGDVELENILQEIATEAKTDTKECSPEKFSVDNIKSPKKQKELFKKLQQFQKDNDPRSPLVPKKSEKKESVTPLKRKNPFAGITRSPTKSSTKRKSSSPLTPACLKRFKRRVVKPPAIEDIDTKGETNQLESTTIPECQHLINEKLIKKCDGNSNSEECKITLQCHNVSTVSNEDIPILDNNVGKEQILDNAMKNLTNCKFLKNSSPLDLSYEEFLSEEKLLDAKDDGFKKEMNSELPTVKISSDAIVLSSDEEHIPYVDDLPQKQQRKVGLSRKTPPQSSSGLVKSKYFGGAKASGLRRKETKSKSKRSIKSKDRENTNKSQPKITSLFSKTFIGRKRLSPSSLENTEIDITPESENTEDIVKIRNKMMATRKLFGKKLK